MPLCASAPAAIDAVPSDEPSSTTQMFSICARADCAATLPIVSAIHAAAFCAGITTLTVARRISGRASLPPRHEVGDAVVDLRVGVAEHRDSIPRRVQHVDGRARGRASAVQVARFENNRARRRGRQQLARARDDEILGALDVDLDDRRSSAPGAPEEPIGRLHVDTDLPAALAVSVTRLVIPVLLDDA